MFNAKPVMARVDSVCRRAWQADRNATWDWNGEYRNGSGGDFPVGVPERSTLRR